MKTVNVETYDSGIFQAVMTIVVKNEDGEYAVLLKDLCEMISLDVKAVNAFLQANYVLLNKDCVPHLELSEVNSNMKWTYTQGGKTREISDEDIYMATVFTSAALPYALLDILRYPGIETKFEEKFAVILSSTVDDCLNYAPKFEY